MLPRYDVTVGGVANFSEVPDMGREALAQYPILINLVCATRLTIIMTPW